MRLGRISTRTVARLGLASLVFVAVIVVAPMAASAAPTASITSPTSVNTYNEGQSVPTAFNCADNDGGGITITSCTDNNGGSGTSGQLNTSSPGNFTYTVTATSSDTLSSTASIGYIVAAPPTASITLPTSGNTYNEGQNVPTSFSCLEGASGPGLATCTDNNGGSGTSGQLNTSSPGNFTYTVTATSTDGQSGSASIGYTVAATSFTVTFLGNTNTSGATSPETNSVAANLTTNGFIKTGYNFAGWSTNAGGGGSTYTDGQSYAFTANITLYAQWTASASFTVTFSANGGTGTMANETANVPTNLTTNVFTRAGYVFADWNTVATGGGTTYTDGQSYPFTTSATLFAQWTANTTDNYSYNAAGGAPTPVSGSGLSGTSITLGAAPTRTGYVFDGWNNGIATYAANISYPLTSNPIVFTALWTANATGGGGGSSTGTTLDQTSPTSGVTTSENSGAFSSGPITVSNATGAVSFVITSSSPALSVSPQGAITTSGTLLAGFYSVSGTDSDTNLDTGTWTFTLTVNTPITVTFVANSGQGSMSPETKSAPTALTPNTFTRPKYKFARWNTVADGSGTSYANGAVFPFTAATTLYAQWTASTKIDPTRKVTFDANGGSGSMKPESKNVLASLKSNQFTRKGFSFIDWNTAANGSKASYANGAAYPFTKSVTLFAQWRAAATFTVTFDANRGSGSMSPETKKTTSALTLNQFKRHGFTFARWNTAANGSGSNYANGGAYHFNASTILFAQWTVVKAPVVLPAVPAVVALSPFAAKSPALSTSLEAQIAALAREIKANRDKKIALVGYSGDLTTANINNEADWAASLKLSVQRAVVVESYLKQQLALLGVTGYTITAVGNRTAIPVSSNATAASQAKSRKVVATVT
jgi:uncharacterized repeat protein (TIGR02543 family)